MQELFDWLGRLETLETSPHTSAIHEHLHRVFAASALDFDGSVVRMIDARQEALSFGRIPGRLSVLAWPDAGPGAQSLEDQAVAAQLGAVLTLATNRRVEVAASDLPLTMEGTNQRTFLPTNLLLDRTLAGPIEVDTRAELVATLGRFYGLATYDRDVLGAATELHYAAALLFDVEPNAAYAMAIAGVERLSRAYGPAPLDWSAWDQAERLDRVFADLALTEEQIDRLRHELLQDRHLRLRQTFASYVVQSLTDDFWQLELEDFVPALTMTSDGVATLSGMTRGTPVPIGRLVPSDRGVLRRRLLRSCDARSSYVHEGARRSNAMTALATQLIGADPGPAEPVEFAGIRTILRTLILAESQERSQTRPLPGMLFMHPGNRPSD